MGLGQVAIDELGPLYFKTDKEIGGLSFDPKQIAVVLTVGGLTLLVWQSLVYGYIDKMYGATLTLKVGMGLLAVSVLLWPAIGALFGNFETQWLVVIVSFAQAMKVAAMGSCFPANFVVTNNSVPDLIKGRVNGAAQTFVSALRTFAPIISGSTFAFSLSIGPEKPSELLIRLRCFVAFIVCSLFFVCGCLLSLLMPKYLDNPFDARVAEEALGQRKLQGLYELVDYEDDFEDPASRSAKEEYPHEM